MFSLLASLLCDAFHAPRQPHQPRASVARYDRGPTAFDARLKPHTWAARLNRAVHSGASRVTFRSPEIEALRDKRALAIRCEVYEARHGFAGPAVFA